MPTLYQLAFEPLTHLSSVEFWFVITVCVGTAIAMLCSVVHSLNKDQ